MNRFTEVVVANELDDFEDAEKSCPVSQRLNGRIEEGHDDDDDDDQVFDEREK